MIRLTQAIAAVMGTTLVGGAAGGIVGALVGRVAPSFVGWLSGPGAGAMQVDPTEFGLGLGVVSGLFLGTGTGVFLVCVLALRDAWLARAGIKPYPAPAEIDHE